MGFFEDRGAWPEIPLPGMSRKNWLAVGLCCGGDPRVPDEGRHWMKGLAAPPVLWGELPGSPASSLAGLRPPTSNRARRKVLVQEASRKGCTQGCTQGCQPARLRPTAAGHRGCCSGHAEPLQLGMMGQAGSKQIQPSLAPLLHVFIVLQVCSTRTQLGLFQADIWPRRSVWCPPTPERCRVPLAQQRAHAR